ncbi:antitoxin YezG family protein [Vreelandella venusta]|uniref:antitoxin YezG family protein n=1 Tax=Vreelandella venusta TaxID=44935 RepID=UPI00200CA1F6|nr:antitoxin YezG family protein [Halomonas venusta]UQI40027.1 antitoxin YezG family protein [Halomonas venusta]
MFFQYPDGYYQAIAEELNSAIKEPWEKVVVNVELFDNSIEEEIVYTRPDGSKESKVSTIMSGRYFYELARVVSSEEKGLYKKCRFVLNNDGSFNIDFEY